DPDLVDPVDDHGQRAHRPSQDRGLRHVPPVRGLRRPAHRLRNADLAPVARHRAAAPAPQPRHAERGELMRYSAFTPYDLVLLLQGLGVTVGLFLLTSLIGVVIGTLWAVVRFYRVPVLTPLVTFLSEVLKNSPVLVQLFLVFFGFP